MRRLPFQVSLLLTLLVACGGGAGVTPVIDTPDAGATPPRITGNLTVFAAASLTDAFNDLKRRIEADNPGTTITFNFAGSSALAAQLEQGARADLFVSADHAQMEKVKNAGVIQGTDRVFIQNKPVIIVPADNPRGIRGAQDLAAPGVKLVLAAPQVPIGNYSRQILDRMTQDPAYSADFSQKALANLVSDEANVRQVIAKIQLGEGDAGIVYASDVILAARDRFQVIPIPDDVNVIARYPIALVRGAANEAGARAFVDYLLSPSGQAILEGWGFIPLGQSSSFAGPIGSVEEPASAVLATKWND